MSVKAISRTIAGAPDYETGTWTPVLEGTTVAGTHTYANQGGTYVRIGNLVWATGIVALSAFDPTTSGNMLITGLPFVQSGGSHNSSGVSIGRFRNISLNVSGGFYFPFLTLPGGVSYIQLNQAGDNVVEAGIAATDMTNDSAMRLTATYVTGTDSVG
jgi:hypothetical protein